MCRDLFSNTHTFREKSLGVKETAAKILLNR